MIGATALRHPQTTLQPLILLVEDEPLLRALVAEHLRDAGFGVIEAADAAEAMAIMLSRAAVDLMFTDIQMPGATDGRKLAHWLRQYFPSVPVLLSSGTTAFSSGGADLPFLRKPYALAELERRIRRLLRDGDGL